MMESRKFHRSSDHVNWWEPEHWKTRKPRSVSSISLEGLDPAEIRNGWLTLPDPKARFQQKQLQEREVKIASLYEAQQARALDRVRHSPSNGVVAGTRASPQEQPIHQGKLQESEMKITSLYEAQQARALDRVHHSPSNGVINGKKASPQEPKVAIHPGKVRQMFEERRSKGIDKSYPLQPIHNTDRTARKPLPNGFSKVTPTSNGFTKTATSTSRFVEKKKVATTRTTVKKTQHHKTDNMVNGSGDLNHNHEQDLHSVKHTFPQSDGEHISGIDELDRADNNYLLENETFPDALAPEQTPRSPEHKEPKRPPRRSPPTRNNQPKAQSQPVAPPRRATSDNAPQRKSPVVSTRASPPAPAAARASPRRTAASPVAAPASAAGVGEPCSVCGRRFAPDRLARHQEICKKAANKKRKPFDALKHRLAGTEAEPFIGKLRKQGANSTSSTKVNKPINNNWRQKHEDFINAIRAAKQVQAHLNAGGKLADLPPPPPSENPDYVQCPHCKRRFNQAAAERHIPKCSSYQFNKSKGPPAKGKR